MTTVRLLGDGLKVCIESHVQNSEVTTVNEVELLKQNLDSEQFHAALVDVTQENYESFREIAVTWPEFPMVAIGIKEELDDVVKCGRAGFAGYIAREATVEELCDSLANIVNGKLRCPPEISGGIMRALYQEPSRTRRPNPEPKLTRREQEVLQQIGHGLTNKEIGKELCLSVATVKHHVHNLLEKLGVPRRADAMRKVQESPWLAGKRRS